MPKWSIEIHTRLIREVKQAQIRINLLIGLKRIKGIKYKIFNLYKIFLEWKEPKCSIETHTILIREVKQAQIRLNLLFGLKGIKYKNCIFE